MILHKIVKADGEERHIAYRCAKTTGEYLGWILVLAHDDHRAAHMVDFLKPYIVEGSLYGVSGEDLMALGEDIVGVKTFAPGFMADVQKWWRTTFQGDDYDPRLANASCSCPACTPDAEGKYGKVTESCKFYGIGVGAQLVCTHDWDIGAECWDLPVEVYQLRLVKKRESVRGQEAREQQRKKEEEDKKRLASQNSPQEWARINAARSRAIQAKRS